jgi:aspartyl-tRNA(Asn)/glutamyl-tRNA(Gln) amidotransferase subunit A
MNLNQETIFSLHEKLVKKECSSVEVLQASQKQIATTDDKLHAFLTMSEKIATDQAKSVDKDISAGKSINLLAGLPASIKDVLMTEGIRTTAGSKILTDYTASFDATVVAKLKQAGMVMVGKNNCDEFAMGSSTENSAYGPTHNPYDIKRVPGGSSGGSATAVAAGQVMYSVGTDTGGSIRQPAAFCGVVGYKPTYGLVSRYGLIAMSSSLDCAGPFTKTVAETAAVLNVIAGKDKYDATTIENNIDYLKNLTKGVKGLRLGLPKEYFVQGLDPEIKQSIMKIVDQLAGQGAEIREVSLPDTSYALPVYYILMPAEVSSNLAKFDGLRFGTRQETKGNLLEYYMHTRGQGFGSEVRRRVLIGTYVLSSGYVDEYYLQAQKVRSKLKHDFEKVFKQVDALITPTTPTTAFAFGEKVSDPVSMYLSDIYTVSANLAGLPALSVPAGQVKKLPFGIQIMGPRFADELVLQIGEAIEQITGPLPKPEL